MSGIRANEIRPLSQPLGYRPGAAQPRRGGLVPLRACKRDTAVMQRQKYIVPSVEVTGLTTVFLSPEPYRVGSMEAYVGGLRVGVRELGSNYVQLRVLPSLGQEVLLNYVPYSTVGGLSKRESKVVVITGNHLVTLLEATGGSTLLFENCGAADVFMPAVTGSNNGLVLNLMRSGHGQVTLYGTGGVSINGGLSYDIELPYVGFELVLDYANLNWVPFF